VFGLRVFVLRVFRLRVFGWCGLGVWLGIWWEVVEESSAAWSSSALGVDGGGWGEPHLGARGVDVPVVAVDIVVASDAQHDAVVHVGEAAVGPGGDVVGVAP
jgi:hypothetical protein